jgi:hypothetical protein
MVKQEEIMSLSGDRLLQGKVCVVTGAAKSIGGGMFFLDRRTFRWYPVAMRVSG